MTPADPPHETSIDELNADLARRLGGRQTTASAPSNTAPVAAAAPQAPADRQADPHDSSRWVPVALAAVLCLALGLGGGWLLFGRSNDQAPIGQTDETVIVEDSAPTADDEPGDNTATDEPLTLEDLFEALPFEQGPNGESPLDGSPLQELPLDDFFSPDDFAQLEEALGDLPTADELTDLLDNLEGGDLNSLIDPEQLDEMTELFEQLFGS